MSHGALSQKNSPSVRLSIFARERPEMLSFKCRHFKQDIILMLVRMKGFEALYSADATLAGIELHHMLRKGQHAQSANQTIFEQFYGLAA